jgi:hypothetical protein
MKTSIESIHALSFQAWGRVYKADDKVGSLDPVHAL